MLRNLLDTKSRLSGTALQAFELEHFMRRLSFFRRYSNRSVWLKPWQWFVIECGRPFWGGTLYPPIYENGPEH